MPLVSPLNPHASPPQVLQDSQAPPNGKAQQVGDRAFRCGYKGCGRLYTTAHHLKVGRAPTPSALLALQPVSGCGGRRALP